MQASELTMDQGPSLAWKGDNTGAGRGAWSAPACRFVLSLAGEGKLKQYKNLVGASILSYVTFSY